MINTDDTATGGKRFFIYIDGRQQGPYGAEELKKHGLSSETLVWADGMEGWTPAWQVAELRYLLDGRYTAENITPPVAPPKESDVEENEDAADRPVIPAGIRKGWRTRRNVVLAVLCLLLVAMALTCPGKDAHKDAVSNEVRKTVGEMQEQDMPWGVIGDIMMSGIASMAVDQMLVVDDYVFFSTGSIHYGDRSRTVSFGIFNHVFTFDAEYVRQAAERE